MHQRIVIDPTRDAVQPTHEHLKLSIAKLRLHPLEQKHGGYFFFEHRPAEKLIGYFHQKIEVALPQNLAAAAPHGPPQISRIPAVRLDFFFEKPLHPGSMLN